ncbi:aromatase [Petromyzon marinus]
MMIAAPDTLSVSLLFMALLIAERPQLQEELHQEALGLLGPLRAPTVRELQLGLPLLERFVSEALRHSPVVDVIMRRAVPTVGGGGGGGGATLGGVPVAPGTNVIVDLRSLHSSPGAFTAPSTFSLDNFAQPVPPRHFQPFGSGPRGCSGKLAAVVMVKATLVTLLRSHRLHAVAAGDALRGLGTSGDLAVHPHEGQAGLVLALLKRGHGGGGGDGGDGDGGGDGGDGGGGGDSDGDGDRGGDWSVETHSH